MSRIKQVLQHDETDCEPACVSIILQYYGKTVPLRKIRAVAGTDKIGTSGFGIAKACNAFGLDCEGLMSPKKENISQIIFIGDEDQLPSVGPGNVWRDLIDSNLR